MITSNRSLPVLWLWLSLIIFSIGIIGCQPSVPSTPASEVPLFSPTETEELLVQVEAIATLTVSSTPLTAAQTPTATSMATPTQTSVFTPTPTHSPTVSPLQKIGDMSVRGQLLTVSPDGTLIAVMDNSAFVLHVFDVVQQEVKWEFEKDTYGFTALAFSSDGSLLAAGGVEQQVFVWDMMSGSLLYDFSVPYTKIESLSFSPDSKLLAASSHERFFREDVDIMLWDMDIGRLVDTFPSQNTLDITIPEEHDNVSTEYATWNVEDISFIPNHLNLLAITILNHNEKDDGSVWALYFWDIEGQELQEILPGLIGFDIVVSPGGQFLATEIDEKLIVWDTQNGQKISEIIPRRTETTPHLALTDTGVIARLEDGKKISIWNLQGELLASLETKARMTDIAFLSDNVLLVASFSNDTDVPIETWQINR